MVERGKNEETNIVKHNQVKRGLNDGEEIGNHLSSQRARSGHISIVCTVKKVSTVGCCREWQRGNCCHVARISEGLDESVAGLLLG